MTRGWSVLATVVTIAILPVVAVVVSGPARACTNDDDVNNLCSNEQAFIDELAAVGMVPTNTPRFAVNQGVKICGDVYRGTPRSVIIQQVYGGTQMRLEQAKAIVAAAENHLCNFAITGFRPNP